MWPRGRGRVVGRSSAAALTPSGCVCAACSERPVSALRCRRDAAPQFKRPLSSNALCGLAVLVKGSAVPAEGTVQRVRSRDSRLSSSFRPTPLSPVGADVHGKGSDTPLSGDAACQRAVPSSYRSRDDAGCRGALRLTG